MLSRVYVIYPRGEWVRDHSAHEWPGHFVITTDEYLKLVFYEFIRLHHPNLYHQIKPDR
jgi:hypothetical protein